MLNIEGMRSKQGVIATSGMVDLTNDEQPQEKLVFGSAPSWGGWLANKRKKYEQLDKQLPKQV